MTISIILILLTLVSTAISTFWSKKNWAKAGLFVLALGAGAAAILHASKTEEESRSVLAILENLAMAMAPPPEFERRFAITARSIVGKQILGQSSGAGEERPADVEMTVRKTEDSGYLLGIFMPDTGGHSSGFPDAYVLVSPATVRHAIREFSKGNEFRQVLEREAFWVWDGRTIDDRFLQSLKAIARQAFAIAVQYVPQDRAGLLSKYRIGGTIRLDVGSFRKTTIDVIAEDPEPYGREHIHLLTLSPLFFNRIENVSAVKRGRMTFEYIVESLSKQWDDPNFSPTVLGR